MAKHHLDTDDNRSTLRAALAAGDHVEFSTTGLTLWRVDHGDGYDPAELAERYGINLGGDDATEAAEVAECDRDCATYYAGQGGIYAEHAEEWHRADCAHGDPVEDGE